MPVRQPRLGPGFRLCWLSLKPELEAAVNLPAPLTANGRDWLCKAGSTAGRACTMAACAGIVSKQRAGSRCVGRVYGWVLQEACHCGGCSAGQRAWLCGCTAPTRAFVPRLAEPWGRLVAELPMGAARQAVAMAASAQCSAARMHNHSLERSSLAELWPLHAEVLTETARQTMVDMVTRIFSGLGKMAPAADALPAARATANGCEPGRPSADNADSAKAPAAGAVFVCACDQACPCVGSLLYCAGPWGDLAARTC